MSPPSETELLAIQDQYLADVNTTIRRAIPDSNTGFFALLRYHLGWENESGDPVIAGGGKSLRSLLCLASCEMSGGKWRQALPAAAALELVHNFSLIHDDIQDGDLTRRGTATLWSLKGTHPALSAGNAMRVLADSTLRKLTEYGVTERCATMASMELTRRYLEMIEGQYMDVSFEDSMEISTNDYFVMVGKKTGALIESSMYLGALVATNDEDVARNFGSCGRRLGLAFQIRDDFLGIWGDPNATGKAVGADIRRRKKSLPVVSLLEHADLTALTWLKEVYSMPTISEANVTKTMDLMNQWNIPQYVQSNARAYAQAAINGIDSLRLTDKSKFRIKSLAEYFISREK
jgi:geranylgeranyl diphosphate synthase type I